MHYQWKELKEEVKKFINNCEICPKTKTYSKVKQPIMITTKVNRPFERICLDIVGPLPKTPSNNIYILTMQDELTRYALAVALTIFFFFLIKIFL